MKLSVTKNKKQNKKTTTLKLTLTDYIFKTNHKGKYAYFSINVPHRNYWIR